MNQTSNCDANTNSRINLLAKLREAERQNQHKHPHPQHQPQPYKRLQSVDITDLFCQRLQATTVTIQRLASRQELPALVGNYIAEYQLEKAILSGNDQRLTPLPWQDADVRVHTRPAQKDDALSLSYALCGIAETGTVVLPSGEQNPTSLNFLPSHHIVVIDQETIEPYWEDAWAQLRRAYSDKQWPRAINFISGPSSTADVAFTQVFGAHGPCNLQVVIIETAK